MYLLSIKRVAFFEFLQHPDLNLASIAVFGYGSYDLDGHPGIGMSVDSFYDFAERPLAQELDSPICCHL